MRIDIDLLSLKSVRSAINTLKTAKTDLNNKMVEEYLKRCCSSIRGLANSRLDNLDIGDEVKIEIKQNWSIKYDKVLHKAILRNTSDKSIYVEFGTGVVGEENPHPMASSTNPVYDYNRPSDYKNKGDTKPEDKDTWIFKATSDDAIDVPTSSILVRTEHTVKTKGAEASLYVYNAIQDFINSKLYVRIWQEIKRKYFK